MGFSGYWTLEMFAVHPMRIYPGIPICQIFYHEVCGPIEEYSSKYQHNRDIQPSLMFEEFASHRKHDPQMPLNFGIETVPRVARIGPFFSRGCGSPMRKSLQLSGLLT